MTRLLWTQKQDIGPAARSGLAMTYDAARKRTLLYGGGSASGASSDTWEWDGEYWVQVQDIGPPALAAHALAFDRVRAKAVLYGGLVDGTLAVHGDTWEWNGADWTQVADSGPSARHSTAMTYDENRERVVMFGGSLRDGTLLSDTWEWDGADWTQVSDIGPSARHAHAMCFDPDRDRTILVAGSGQRVFADTWTWDGERWVQIADSGPEPTAGATLTFASGASILFGGMSDLGVLDPDVRGDTWELDGDQWTRRQNMGPAPRAFHGVAHDSERGRVVMFGGTDAALGSPDATDHLMGDTWEHTVPIDPDLRPPGGLEMSVSPSTVQYMSFVSIDFSLADAQPVTIPLRVLVGKEVRMLQIPPMTTHVSVKVAVDTDVMDPPPPGRVEVVAHVDGYQLRQTIDVVP